MKRKIIAISFSILTLLVLFNPNFAVHAQDVRLRSTAETPFDTDGQFTVSWDVVPNAPNYALEEATNIEFIGSAEYYPTSNYQDIISKDGVFFYRVRANIPINGVDNYTDYLGGILVVSVHIPPPVDITTVILILSFIVTIITSSIDIYYRRKSRD
ncbi:MAG: hypothetical protein ACE5I5_09135 [Candidatus Heimdallarchaeota archaeon]